MGRIPKKHFSIESQREAVRILEAGRTKVQLSRELGVSKWTLTRWENLHAVGATGAGSVGRSPKGVIDGDVSTVQMANELAGVRAELYTVTRQRDILKKALAILGQESPNSIF